MSASKQAVTLNFQDASGQPLASGYVTFRLSQDISSGAAVGPQISAGITTQATLDSSGDCTVLLWPNDPLEPNGTVYFVSAYTQAGQLAWQGEIHVASGDYITQEDGVSLLLLEGSIFDALLQES
jgi:hypothetical protein